MTDTAKLTVNKKSAPGGGTGFRVTMLGFVGTWGGPGSGSDNGQFNAPQGVGTDAAGNVYVADTGNARIQKFDTAGTFLRAWGGKGRGNGQFYKPISVAADGAGNVFVADEDGRVQKFDGDGTYLSGWGGRVSDQSQPVPDGMFRRPSALTVDSVGNVYVADSMADLQANRIQKFDGNGVFLAKWSSWGTTTGKMYQPEGVAADGAGNVYVADSLNLRVQKFDAAGAQVAQWQGATAPRSSFKPMALTRDGAGNIFVTDHFNHLQRFDSDGRVLNDWTIIPAGQQDWIPDLTSVAADGAGHLYATDSKRHCVYKFLWAEVTLDDGGRHDFDDLLPGRYVIQEAITGGYTLSEISGDIGQPATVRGAAPTPPVVPPGAPPPPPAAATHTITLAAGDHATCTLTSLKPVSLSLLLHNTPPDEAGHLPFFLTMISPTFEWGSRTEMVKPYGAATAPIATSLVYVLDRDARRVRQFDGNGALLGEWGGTGSGRGEFDDPRGIGMRWDGQAIYVADSNNHRIQQFDAQGHYETEYGSRGSADGQFDTPCAVAAYHHANDFFVADTGNNRIQKFDNDGGFLTKWGVAGTADGQFNSPQGVALFGNSNVYVADTGNHRIQVFDGDGAFLGAWGSRGSDPGQFDSPVGIEVDGQGNVYVADTGNARVQMFDSRGNFLTQWGGPGAGDGRFDRPAGLVMDGIRGVLYVTDSGNGRVQRYVVLPRGLRDGQSVPFAGGAPGTYLFVKPGVHDGSMLSGVEASSGTLTRDGDAYRLTTAPGDEATVTFHVGRRPQLTLAVNNTSGVPAAPGDLFRFLVEPMGFGYDSRWGGPGDGEGRFNSPRGAALNRPGNLYVADSGNHRIQKFFADGRNNGHWGSLGSGAGQFNNPVGVAVDGEYNVYVADSGNHRMQKFDAAGNFLLAWGWGVADGRQVSQITNGSPQAGLAGIGQGQFDNPSGVGVDGAGNVYVADTNNHRVQMFDKVGDSLGLWGSYGSGPGQFDTPQGVAVDGTGNIYVADTGNHRVQKFDAGRGFLAAWGGRGSGDGQFDGPAGVAVDGAGNVYVSDGNNARIQKFDANGNFLARFGVAGSGDGQFSAPHGVAVDFLGRVYVVDSGNARIQRLMSQGTVVLSGSNIQSRTLINLAPGTYAITELPPPGWTISGVQGDGATTTRDGNVTRVTLAPGDAATCTFTLSR